MRIELNIGSLLIGEKSDKVFLYVHGLHGRKQGLRGKETN